jgi:hypothetical protein
MLLFLIMQYIREFSDCMSLTPSHIQSSSEQPDPPSSKKSLAGPVAGGVVGGLILLGALGFFLYRCRRQHHPNTPLFPDGLDAAVDKQPATP